MHNFDTSHLTTRQADLVARCQAILSQARDEDRDVTADEKAELRDAVAQVDGLTETTGMLSKLDAASATSAGRKSQPDLMPSQGGAQAPRAGRLQAPEATELPRARDRTWAGMWGRSVGGSDGWRGGEFFTALGAGHHDPRFRAAASEGSGASGGWLVPSYLTTDILDRSLQSEIVRPLARTYRMSGPDLAVTSLNTRNRSDGSTVAGLAGEWLAELATASLQTPTFEQVNLHANKLVVYCQASEELVADAMNFESELRTGFSNAIAYNLDRSFLFGSGVGSPLGVMNSPALVTVDAEVSQVADIVTFNNVTACWARLSPGCHSRAVWVVAPSVLPQLMQLRVFTYAGTSPDQVVDASPAPAFTVNADGSYSLLGKPLKVSEHMKPVGDLGDILPCDFDAVAVGMRMEFAVQADQSNGWRDFSRHFRGWLRVAGVPLLASPITLPNGAPSVSPYVTLEART